MSAWPLGGHLSGSLYARVWDSKEGSPSKDDSIQDTCSFTTCFREEEISIYLITRARQQFVMLWPNQALGNEKLLPDPFHGHNPFWQGLCDQ